MSEKMMYLKNVYFLRVYNVRLKDFLKITQSGILAAIKDMRNRRAPGEDQLTAEVQKISVKYLTKFVKLLFNRYLEEGRLLTMRKYGGIILHKKKIVQT